MEFRTKRRKNSSTLFSGDLIQSSDKCDKFKKQNPKVNPQKTEEVTITDASFLIKEEAMVATMKQQRPMIVRIKLKNTDTKFQIPKGPTSTPEKKVNDDHGVGFYYDQGVALVMSMKKILDKSTRDESEWEVLDLLTKLESMGLLVKTLEVTNIGITVGALKKHGSENVRMMAVKLVKSWKDTVNQYWIKKQSTSNSEKKLEGSDGGVMNSFEKVEATKRKQSASENIKSQFGKACSTMIPIKSQIKEGPMTPEKKIDDHGARVYNQEVVEVLRIKKMLDSSGDEVEVCDLLTKLQGMGLSYKTLEATVIGKPVTALKKHPSKNVCEIAGTLVRAWKCTADEWIEKQENHPTFQKFMPSNLNTMNMDRKKFECSPKNAKIVAMDSSEKEANETYQKMMPSNLNIMNIMETERLQKDAKIGNCGAMVSMEKLEATKRKLQEGYEKVENMKKKRRVQVLELHEVTKQGLLPKKTQRINRNSKKVYWR